jgi:hypothetical protein
MHLQPRHEPVKRNGVVRGAVPNCRSGARSAASGIPTAVAGLFALLTLISLALPVAVLAHGGSGETDGDATLAAGAAVGGAGLGAAAGANRRQGRPKMFDVKRPGGTRPRRKTPPPATPPSAPPPPDPPDAGSPPSGGGGGQPFGPRGPQNQGPPPLKDFKQPGSAADQRTSDGLKGLTGQK